jgi:hypothetical protein
MPATAGDVQDILDAIATAGDGVGGCFEVPARTTYTLTAGPLVLPHRFALIGKGASSVITKPNSIITALTANAAAGATVLTVASTTGFVVGHGVGLWDTATIGSLATHAKVPRELQRVAVG